MGEEDLKWVWVIFRSLSITAVQWLLPIRLGDATAAFISVTSLTWTVSKRHERRQDKKEPSSHIPSPLCHNNSFHFRGQDGAMVYCSKSWTVGFLESDIYPWANPGKESELVIIALIPEPNAQHLIFSPFPKHEKPPTHPLSIFIPTKNHIQNERLWNSLVLKFFKFEVMSSEPLSSNFNIKYVDFIMPF